MKCISPAIDGSAGTEILSVSADGEIKVWTLDRINLTSSTNKTIVKAKVSESVGPSGRVFFIVMMADDGHVFVYRYDAMGILKTASAQTWMDREQGRQTPRLADFELTTDNGKNVLIFAEKFGKLRAYELE